MVLDYNKLDNAYKNLGISIEDNDRNRRKNGIKVLDHENVEVFLVRINKYKTTKEELNYLLLENIKRKNAGEDLLDF